MAFCLSVPPGSSTAMTRGSAADSAAESASAIPAGANAKEWNEILGGSAFNSIIAPMVAPTVTANKTHSPAGPFHLGDTITYSVTISDTGADATGVVFTDMPDPNTTLVAGSVMASPLAVDDSYACTGNLSIAVPAGSGVLANDYLGLNPVATITASDTTSANSGTVAVAADGSFTYEPAAGFRGADTFTYTLSNSTGSSVGTVTINVSNMVWFINNASTCASNCNGRFSHPFTTLAAFQAINDGATNHAKSGDAIFIYQGSGNYTGPLTLLSNQRLTGQGDSLNSTTLGFTPAPATNVTLPSATAKPTLTGTLTLASGVTALAIDLNTGASTGLAGSGGLTGVTVGDAPPTTTNGFTVTTTTGTAVSLNNVGGTFTFRSLAANGAAHGITLTTTTGSFDVEGDGASDVTNTTRGRTTAKSGGGTLTLGSGGTIQNTTASGLVLSSAANVTLRNMVIQNNGGTGVKNGNDGMTVTNGSTLILDNTVISGTPGNNGLHATGLAGLTIEHCEIHDNATNSGVAGGTEAWNVRLDEVTGTVAVDNSKLQNSVARVMGAQNHTTTSMTLNVTNSLFDGGSAINNGSALAAEAFDTASLTLSFTGGTANNGRNGEGVNANYNNSSTGSFTVKNSSLDNNGVDNGGGADIAVASTKGNVTFDIENNTTRANTTVPAGGNTGTSISADLAGTANLTSVLQGKILNNTVGNAAVAKSASTAGAGIAVQANTGVMTVNISGNTVNQSGSEGIAIIASGVSASLTATINATVQNNTATVTDNVNATDGLSIAGGGGGFADTVCANVSGNVKFDASNNVNAIGGVNVVALGGCTISLQGYSGAANNTSQLVTFLNGTATTVNPTASVLIIAPSTIKGASSACSTPALALMAMAPEKAQSAQKASDVASQEANPPEVPSLMDSELPPLVAAALYRWQTAGISSKDLERLRAISFRVSDLAKPHLSEMVGDEVLLDRTAAGYGWFVDSNAYSDLQFDQQISSCTAIAGELSPANSRIDLLSVIIQAFGVVLEQAHPRAAGALETVDDESKSAHSRLLEKLFELTQVSLSPGTRRVPDTVTTGPRLIGMTAQANSLANETAAPKQARGGRTRRSGGQVTPQAVGVSVALNNPNGLLPAGKSFIVKFQVTVNNPLTSPSTANSVSNTGQVSGTNFTTVNSNTDTAELCVPPVTTTPLTNQQVAAGSTATFTTTLTGSTPFTFVWKQGTTILTTGSLGGRVTITTTTTGSSTTSTLQITGATPADSATYSADGTDLAACGDPAVHQTATLTVVSPPTITKAFSPTTIPLNGVSTITLTLTNPNTGVTLTGVNFSDNFPAGLKVANPATPTSTCTGTWNATPGDTTLNFGGGTLAPGTSCTLTVKVTATTAGVINNATNAPQSTEGGTGVASNTATLTVVGPPTIAKSFAASTVALNGTVNLNFTITNPNTFAGGDLTGITFTDTLPSGLAVADSGPTSTCSGSLSTVHSTGTITFIGGALAHGATPTTCTFSVPVTGTSAGVKNNTTGAISSTEGGTGNTASASVTVVAPPSISKAFGAVNIAVGGTTSLSFTITNPNSSIALTGVGFTDALPGGLSAVNGTSTQCGGTLAITGGNTIMLSGATVAASGTCTFSVTVTGVSAGVQNNTTGAVTSTNGGTGNTASASVTVASPPTITKGFGNASILVGATTSLTFSITNPNTGLGLTGITFTDTLPVGLSVPTATAATCGGTLTSTAPNTISFTGGALAATANCSFSVTVTGVSAGIQSNITGVISSNESGPGATSNTAMVTVIGAPTISKSFSAATICTGGVATLTFTITNPNTSTAFTGIAFNDSLPSGLQVAPTPNASTTCTGGTFAPNAGDTSLTFTKGQLAANSTCKVQVDVTGTTVGTKNNTSGTISSTEGGTGGTSNTATLTVVAPPVAVNDTFATKPATTLNQPAPGVLANDTLNGASIFSYGATTGGEQTTIGAATPTSAGGSISLNADGSFSYTPAAAFHGVDTFKYVLKSPGGCTSMATVSISVAAAPTISKAFGLASIPVGGTTSLMFTITNPNSSQSLSGITFTDALPAGLSVPNGTAATCGGTVTTTAPGMISFSGGMLAASGTCSFSVTVTGVSAGIQTNITGVISSNESGPGATSNSANVTVVGPANISKSFSGATIPLGGTATLTFTITNNNATTTLTGVGFTDTLPAGLVVASTPNASTSCGGTFAPNAGDTSLTFSGGTISSGGGTCTVKVDVTGTTAGVKNNTSGAVTSNEGGTGTTSNTATITVVAPPTIAKSFGAASIPLNGTTSLNFTITNPNSTVALAGVGFTDTLPAGLTTPNNAGSSQCGGTLTVTTNNTITLAGGTIAAGGNCTFSVAVTGTTGGVKNNTTGAVSSTNGGTGTTSNTATLTVGTPPTISKSFGAATVPLGGTTSLTFTITNTNATLGITGVAFTDTLPAGLTVANGSSATCGGGTLVTGGGNMITLTGGSIAAGGSCTMSVTVTGAAAGVNNNTTGPVSANETGTGVGSNTATLTVLGPPMIAKAFGAATVPLNQTTSLTFTLTNPNATVGLTGVAFTDVLPAGLTVANGSSTTCGGGTLVTSGGNTITLTGATIATGGNCSFTTTVTGTTAGVKNNTTGAVTSANGGTGAVSNTATITVVAPPTITKAFGASFVPVGQSTTLTFTLTNPNPTVALTGVAFTDTFPTGLAVANPANPSDGCGGAFAPNPGDTTLSFSGGTIAAGGSCVISVSVTVTTGGSKSNTTGPITSDNGGTGSGSNTVTLVTFDKCLRDDLSGNFVQFSSMTGDYRFVQCNGGGNATLAGTGTLTINGNILTITDRKPDRSVSIGLFTNTGTGHATITIVFAPGVLQTFSINDTNPHPVCSCGP
jgi:uncharacterized repeat protein (TIGR01451 family)